MTIPPSSPHGLIPQAASGPIIALDDTILELLPSAVYVCNADGVIVRHNRKAAELWGRAPRPGDTDERFCGAHKLYWPDGRHLPHHETPMVEVLRTGLPVRDAEVVIEQPSGLRLWVLVNIESVRNEAGDIVGAINCFQDITARKQAENRQHESETLLRAIIETTPDCIMIVGPDGALVQMNSAGLRMIEADGLEAVKGKSTCDLIASEHKAAWLDYHQRVCLGESLSWEFDVIGLKGTRRHMETHAVPLALPDGKIAHLAVTRDVSDRKQQEEKLRASERHARDVLEALPAAVYTTDASGRLLFYNQAALALWGYQPDPNTIRWCGSHKLYWPDSTPLPHDQCPMAMAIKEDRQIRGAEALVERPDGTRIPFMAYPTPLHDSSGRLVGAVNMLVDIAERKKAEDHQQLLIHELNHRVKNTLATVQSIAAQSFRDEARGTAHQHFERRLMALSRAHDVLTREQWEGAGLREVAHEVMAPLHGLNGARFGISGPDLRLTPQMTLSLSMALHELCTNAAKYGALSNETGQISLSWEVRQGMDGEVLRLCWTERGGPPVEAPRRRGFGSRLIEQGLARELNAEVRLSYLVTGVTCEIDTPLAHTARV